MKRWNGWGDDSIDAALPEDGIALLQQITGKPEKHKSMTFDEALKKVGKSALASYKGKGAKLLDLSAEQRLFHSRGQSFPDWVAFRLGKNLSFPDAVSFPESESDIRMILKLAEKTRSRIIIYGGGTSVVGHINRPSGNKPVIVMDMSRMNRLLHVDAKSRLARFQAGIRGPEIEAALASHGFLLGHFPQSYQYSTLGGWIATRSSGQQSLYYGRIEQMFQGGRFVTSSSVIDLPGVPASAAGPDLKEMIMGSEGRMGVITEATMQIQPIPQKEEFHGIFFPDISIAEDYVRSVIQRRMNVSMLRLSSGRETFVTLALAGHSSLIGLLEKFLSLRGLKKEEKCLLIVGFTGERKRIRQEKSAVFALAREYSGVRVGRRPGDAWKKNRFHGPYLRNTLWDQGWGVDTLETALPWVNVRPAMAAIEQSIEAAAAKFGENVLVYTHLSHIYNAGSAIYTTYVFRLQTTPEKTLSLWKAMKDAASKTINEWQGTISHQHGVGKDHIAYLKAEKSTEGLQWIDTIVKESDPKQLFASGNLIADNTKGKSGKKLRT